MTALSLSTLLALGALLHSPASGAGARGEDSALHVATAYLDALVARDVGAAAPLFHEDALIFERGGVEGDWPTYREHHLAPELEHVLRFDIQRGSPTVIKAKYANMTVVAWPLAYEITLQDGRQLAREGTVTFVVTRKKRKSRISHLHWSSRVPK